MTQVVFHILSMLHDTFPCILSVLCQPWHIVSHLLCIDDKILVPYDIMVIQRYKIRSKNFSICSFHRVTVNKTQKFFLQLSKQYQNLWNHLVYFSITACSPILRISPSNSSRRLRLCKISAFFNFPVSILFFSTSFSLYAKLERLILSCIFKPT